MTDKPLARQTTNQIIAKEGMKPLLICGALVLLFIFLSAHVLAAFCAVLLLLIAFIFRNSERIAESRDKDAIIAPCDGMVTHISRFDGATILKIRVNVFDVGIFRTPMFVDDVITAYRHGLFIHDDENLKEILNTRHYIEGLLSDKIVYKMILLPEIWNKVAIYEKSLMFTGDRLGFMKYGHVVLYIYEHCSIKIQVGQSVFAGETLVGILS